MDRFLFLPSLCPAGQLIPGLAEHALRIIREHYTNFLAGLSLCEARRDSWAICSESHLKSRRLAFIPFFCSD